MNEIADTLLLFKLICRLKYVKNLYCCISEKHILTDRI